MSTATVARLSYNLKDAALATGLSRSQLLAAVHAGELPAKKSGVVKDGPNKGEPTGKFLIRAADLEAYIDGLVDA